MAIDTNIKEVNEERYDDMLEILPPIFLTASCFKTEPGKKVFSAFGVSEPAAFGAKSVVLTCCWKEKQPDGTIKHYEQLREVFTPDKKPIDETYGHHYGRGYIANPIA